MHDVAFDAWRQALETAGMVAAPFLIAGVVVGVASALVQAATQVQEQALSFVPKIIALGVMLALTGPWMMGRLVTFGRATMGDQVVQIGRQANR